ncbi:DUF3742 family protein [Salmonella enterica subsp. enterica]|uniref:DUF3742 family protein n=1 Tax=Salmonella enterica subsp. enterica serovar Kintambo TaxID=1192730 RepID=A0A5W7RZ22_SALET|nr:DUF3742 family protein [Salmonella enterica subsp. enterica serovar Kintambo]ECE6153311.1 hypothetical protein [Salmonella enterica subsp. enterica]ELX7028033.1 DUF3742 family protein [Salmonella enterica]MLP08464.1 hypothetical protein [Salmonella enterica subsp. enterica serovar Kedougou]ECJ4522130.1 hypothetical protein [Salmonella enterica subsp. enterica]
MKQNLGYRIGMQTRRFMRWLSVWENEMQQQGVPRWVTKIPLYLCIAAAVGLLLAGAFFIVGFLALMVFIAWYLSVAAGSSVESVSDESNLEGYASGPEGPGMYSQGEKISYKDYDDY